MSLTVYESVELTTDLTAEGESRGIVVVRSVPGPGDWRRVSEKKMKGQFPMWINPQPHFNQDEKSSFFESRPWVAGRQVAEDGAPQLHRLPQQGSHVVPLPATLNILHSGGVFLIFPEGWGKKSL